MHSESHLWANEHGAPTTSLPKLVRTSISFSTSMHPKRDQCDSLRQPVTLDPFCGNNSQLVECLVKSIRHWSSNSECPAIHLFWFQPTFYKKERIYIRS